MSRSFLPMAVVIACTAYAVVRYTVFGDVSLEQLPVYVMNKGVSFGGLILLAWSRCSADPGRRRYLGVTGLTLVALHVVLSAAMLNPAYFGKFYHATGLMTWQAETSILAGAVALLLLGGLFVISQNDNDHAAIATNHSLIPYAARLVLLLTAAHVGLMGYAGWLTPQGWHGYLPPITLLSFVVAIFATLRRRAS